MVPPTVGPVQVEKAGDDVAYGQGGNDTIRGNSGADRLYGGLGNDYISGGPKQPGLEEWELPRDWLFGLAGNDTLGTTGGAGHVEAGAGNDTLWTSMGRCSWGQRGNGPLRGRPCRNSR